MTNFIPIFPLSVIVFPGENLNLHIFEPRYKQLINECQRESKAFGIPAVINNKMNEMGTLVKIVEIVRAFENGEMDIRTEGTSIFRILEIIKTIPDKLYSGAIVNYPENVEDQGKLLLMRKVIEGVRQLHRLLHINKEFKKPDEQLTTYDIAHHAGLSLEEEYELLGLLREDQRQEYLKRHLNKVLPVIAEMETLKEKVKLNGHFKNLSSFEFEE
ncbi:MAG: LON peptidase substrate-binding domain-containing protein [Chitinophagales bacterium]